MSTWSLAALTCERLRKPLPYLLLLLIGCAVRQDNSGLLLLLALFIMQLGAHIPSSFGWWYSATQTINLVLMPAVLSLPTLGYILLAVACIWRLHYRLPSRRQCRNLELHDKSWVPHWIRTCLTVWWVHPMASHYTNRGIGQGLAQVVLSCPTTRAIHIVGAGSGYDVHLYMPTLQQELGGRELPVLLSDLYPQPEEWLRVSKGHPYVSYDPTPHPGRLFIVQL